MGATLLMPQPDAGRRGARCAPGPDGTRFVNRRAPNRGRSRGASPRHRWAPHVCKPPWIGGESHVALVLIALRPPRRRGAERRLGVVPGPVFLSGVRANRVREYPEDREQNNQYHELHAAYLHINDVHTHTTEQMRRPPTPEHIPVGPCRDSFSSLRMPNPRRIRGTMYMPVQKGARLHGGLFSG